MTETSPQIKASTSTTNTEETKSNTTKKWDCYEYGAYLYKDLLEEERELMLSSTGGGSESGGEIEVVSLTTRDSSSMTTEQYSDIPDQMTSTTTTITLNESLESSSSTPLTYTPSIESPTKSQPDPFTTTSTTTSSTTPQQPQQQQQQEQEEEKVQVESKLKEKEQQHEENKESGQKETTETTPQSETPKRSLGSSTLSLKRSQSLTDQNVLIIINNSISMLHVQFLWKKCSVKICADGGANKLFNITQNRKDFEKWIPDYIKGDLDSLQEDVSDFYSKKGTSIILDTSQDTTDLQKCMELVSELEENTGVRYNNIFIAGGLGGNTSHEMANINTLFLYKERKMILVSNTNIGWLLEPSQFHEIDCRVETKCSLLPLGQNVEKATTNGLKWNLGKLFIYLF